MLLAEELILLLLDDQKGTMPAAASMKIDTLLGGAVLVELALLERVGVTAKKPGGKPDRLAVLADDPTGDALLDAALDRLRKKDGKSAWDAVGIASKDVKRDVTERLVAAGALDEERSKILGIFPSRTLPAANPQWEHEVRARVGAVLDGSTTPDPHTGSIIALLLAGDLLDAAIPLDDRAARKDRKARAEQIAAGSWASDATKQALVNAQAMLIAITVAVFVPTIAGAGGS